MLGACDGLGLTAQEGAAQRGKQDAPGLSIRSPSLASATAIVGDPYVLQPVVRSIERDTLKFRVSAQPAWTRFDAATGALHGTPAPADIGTYRGIIISTGNGHSSVSLGPLSITVVPRGSGAATITWQRPARRTDGSPLRDLAGYRVYYGTAPAFLDRVREARSPVATALVIDGLQPGTWYFAVTAYSKDGVESVPSGAIGKQVQ